MATYSLKINERSTQGQALLAYLEALKVDIKKVPSVRVRKSSYERSMDDIKHGRIEKFASADEMCKSLGIWCYVQCTDDQSVSQEHGVVQETRIRYATFEWGDSPIGSQWVSSCFIPSAQVVRKLRRNLGGASKRRLVAIVETKWCWVSIVVHRYWYSFRYFLRLSKIFYFLPDMRVISCQFFIYIINDTKIKTWGGWIEGNQTVTNGHALSQEIKWYELSANIGQLK